MITQRATLVGILGFCLYLIAFVNVLPTFYLLTWLALGILLSSLGIALLSLVGLDCTWEVAHARVAEALDEPAADAEDGELVADGEREATLRGPLLDVTLANRGTLNKINVLLDVCLDCAARDEVLSRRFLLESLPSGSSLAALLPLTHLPRGRYTVRQVRLIGSDVLGLFRIRKRVTVPPRSRGGAASRDGGPPAAAELVVGPAMVSWLNVGRTDGTSDQVGRTGLSRMLGHSDELRGTRPYSAGDDLRRVHWRSTARHGRLIVKEFHNAAQSQALVVWDGARDGTWGEEPEAAVEFGLRVTASLCRLLGEAGLQYTLVRMDSTPRLLTAADTSITTPASLVRVIELLADADAERAQPLSSALAGYLDRLRHIDEVYLVTAAPDADLRPVVEYWRVRGARVTVGLVQAVDPTPRPPARPPRRWLRGRGAPRGATSANQAPDGLSVGHEQSLEKIGARVVVLRLDPTAGDALSALHRAVSALVERQPSVPRSNYGRGLNGIHASTGVGVGLAAASES